MDFFRTTGVPSAAGLPPSYGLYSAVVASIAGALWGSSRYLSTGPTNAISILVLSILTPLAAIGAPEYLIAASTMAVMVGVFCIVFSFAGLGMLVNFASRAVLLGFTAGAGVLIAAGQIKNLFRLDVPRSPHLLSTLSTVIGAIEPPGRRVMTANGVEGEAAPEGYEHG